MNTLKVLIDTLNGIIWNTPSVFPFMVLLLLSTGLFLTFRLGFIQLRRLGHSLRAIMGKYDDPKDEGDINHFQALSSAVSATVGIGNIAGVATAVHYGGPGSVFWLWLTGFIGMASKFTECTLSMKYRVIHEDGSVSGGPMYYIEKAFGPKWKWLAVIFAGCTVISSFGSGNSIQAFTMADSFRSDFGIPNWISGLLSATMVGLVIIGGIKRIGKVTSRLVPFMGSLYVLSALIIVLMNISSLPAAIYTIVSHAFSPPGIVGGFAGSTFIFTLTWGVKRGLFSNEAGQGSAPIAHAAAKTDEPVREGAVALMEPFIDTVVICFMTGLVIVLTGTWNKKFDDPVNFTPKNAINIVRKGTAIEPKGVLPPGSFFTGETSIKNGRIMGVDLVRNHSIIDDCILMVDQSLFNGKLIVNAERKVSFLTEDGRVVPDYRVMINGRSLLNGSPLTAMSFKIGLEPIFPYGNYIVTLSVFLFAISTAISWSYYGDRAIRYLLGAKAVLPYKIVFTLVHFLGAIFSLEVVWGFGDMALGLMALPNLITILLLSGEVKRDSKDYFMRMDAEDKEG